MANKSITVSQQAYKLLEKRKTPHDDSFTKVILRHFRQPADTCAELMERLEQAPPPRVNLDRMETYVKQRGRRSRR